MKLTTTVYKYKRGALLILVLLILVTLVIFFYSNVAGVIVLIFAAVYGAVRPKSIFSLRSADERELVLTPDEITWGTLKMPIEEIEKLTIHIHAFDSFKRAVGKVGRRVTFTTEYGDKNTIAFTYRGTSYDLTFYLGTFAHYDILIRIIQRWREEGIVFTAHAAYTDSYIREQVRLLGESS